MNVLVTGGAGFIGTNLIKQLIKRGANILSIDNYTTGKKSNHVTGNVTYIKGDVATIDFEKVAFDHFKYERIDVVYHLAAIARIQPSFEQPKEYFKTNATGTFNVAKFCADNKIPLQYSGSSSHHSGKFKNPYTFSKDIGEEIVHMFIDLYSLQASISRFYNVYGPHHLKEGGYCTLIGKWEKAYEEKKDMIIYGTGEKRRDFTHVEDIVNALILIHEKKAYSHIFELGYGSNYSINEIREMFKYPKFKYEADKPGEAFSTLCEDTLAIDLLGWRPNKTIQEYIENFISPKI
tara:strand:- start:81 stop:956 length:876 start_codon:yes stop_codon:yes gene_type:complete